MELAEYPRILQRRWPVIAVLTIAALVLAWFSTPDTSQKNQADKGDTTYQAQHVLLVNLDLARGNGLGRLVLFATAGTVPERAIARLDGEGAAHRAATQKSGAKRRDIGKQRQVWLGSTAVTVVPNVMDGSLAVTAEDRDPDRAIAAANALAEELVLWNQRSEQTGYEAQLTNARTRYAQLEDRIAMIQGGLVGASDADQEVLLEKLKTVASQSASVEQDINELEQAGPPRGSIRSLEKATYAEPVAEKEGRLFTPPTALLPRLAIAMLLGLLLGIGLVLVLERFDSSVRNTRAIESIAALPVIAEVPYARPDRKNDHAAVIDDPTSRVAEAYRGLRTSISLMWLASGRPVEARDARGGDAIGGDPSLTAAEPRVILVTSPGPGEGKSVTAANLAAAFAENGRSVIVLDLDFRRPQIHSYLAGARSPGLSDVDAAAEELDDVLQNTAQPGLRFIAAMRDDAPPAVAIARARAAVAAASRRADVVVLDAPPILLANDTYDLMAEADALVLVVREGRTDRGALSRASELLLRLAAPIVGIALIGAPRGFGGGLPYAYRGHYGAAFLSTGRSWLADWRRRLRREPSDDEDDDLIRLP